MKKLGMLFDSVAKVNYELVQMPLEEVKQLVVQGLSIKEGDVIRFDSGSEYVRPDYQGKRKLALKEQIRPRHAQLGLEHTPFILSFDAKDNRYRILDGFNRLFGHTGTLGQDVLVKVYTNISPKTWINVMMHANAWKVLTDGRGSHFMDRGFRLSLQEHFGIDLAISPTGDQENFLNYERAMGAYASNSSERILDTLLNNGRFVEDIALMKELLLTQLQYHNKTRKVDEMILESAYDFNRYSQGFDLIKKCFVNIIGHIRRVELSKNLEQKAITMELAQSVFNLDSLQKHYVKVTNMQVQGHAENYVEKHIVEPMKEHLYTALGYPYVSPEEKKARQEKKSVIVTDNML